MAVLLSSIAYAIGYDVIVVDKGQALVVASIEGSGLHTLPLPEDVIDVEVEGALYLIKDHHLEISIGSTKKALVAYKTDELTTKDKDQWNFTMALPKGSDVTVNLPESAIIKSTVPEALIESGQYKTVAWQDQDGQISIAYSFAQDNDFPITGNAVAEQGSGTPKTFLWALVLVLGATLLFVGSRLIIKYKKPEQIAVVQTVQTPLENGTSIKNPLPARSEKETVLKTLSENELNVVKLLMNNQGGMRRNILEKESTMAKSSLASTLYNLERKNIVIVNKTYAVHFVQLTEWFSKL